MMNIKKRLFLTLATIFVLAVLSGCSSVPQPSTARPTPTVTPTPLPQPVPALDGQRTLKVEKMERTYLVHIPAGLNDQQLVALVFVFHGFQENGNFARTYSGLDSIASANGFVAVYPDGSGDAGSLSWNAGLCCGYAVQNKVDEPAFVRAIIADVQTMVKIDPRRVYAAGFSNGALLSYRLACEMSDTFAAIAPVAGVLTYQPCEPRQAVSVLHAYGTKDQVVPFDGGGSGLQFPSVRETLNKWKEVDGCDGDEKVEHNGIVTHTSYEGCKPGLAVELYAVDGIGHSWPSKYIVPLSQIIWDFFAAHPKP